MPESEKINPLYKILPLHTPILIGDRSLSTFGRRSLKSLRVQKSNWPVPGLYSIVDLAKKILKQNACFTFEESPLSLFRALVTLRKQHHDDDDSPPSVAKIYDDFSQARRQRKVISPLQAGKILANRIEFGLSAKSRNTLTSLILLEAPPESNKKSRKKPGSAQRAGQSPTRIVHPFQYLDLACEILEKSKDPIDFHSLEDIDELFVLGFRDLYPSERRLLQLLEERYAIQHQADLLEERNLCFPEHGAQAQAGDYVLWASELDPPGPMEAGLLAGIESGMRLGVEASLRDSSATLLKMKEMWQEDPASVLRGPFGWAFDKDPLIQSLIEEKTPQGIGILEELGYFFALPLPDLETRTLPSSKSLNDPLLLSLEDLPLVDPPRTLLWADPKKVRELILDFALEPQIFKDFPDLERACLAQGLALPLPEIEQHNFEKMFSSFSDDFRYLVAPIPKAWEQTDPYVISSSLVRNYLSPSGLENLFRCPLNFYFQKEARLDTLEFDDALETSPLRRGNWIHYALEKLPWDKAHEITQSKIEQSLQSTLDRAFAEKASADFLTVLRSQIPLMSESLLHYVRAVDLPLYKSYPQRRSQCEEAVECHWDSGLRLRGRVDRLDFVGNGAFLWDYKTGNFSQNKLSKHLENGKFQWLLYREIFARAGVPIHGGGYINPLDIKKSRLFFFSTFDRGDKSQVFFQGLDEAQIRYEFIEASEEEALRQRLFNLVNGLKEIWKSGSRPARPHEEAECDRCSFVGRCGFPYGVTP